MSCKNQQIIYSCNVFSVDRLCSNLGIADFSLIDTDIHNISRLACVRGQRE